MLVACFGSIHRDVLTKFEGSDHTLMVTDHPAEAETAKLLKELKLKHVVARAEWRNLGHPTSKVGTRVNNASGEVEDYNTNGGWTRDSRMAEQAEAILFGHGVQPQRREMVEHYAGDTPWRDVEQPKLKPEEAKAELNRIFNEQPKPKSKPKPTKQKPAKSEPEPVDDSVPY